MSDKPGQILAIVGLFPYAHLSEALPLAAFIMLALHLQLTQCKVS
jgi:hypothetical protein